MMLLATAPSSGLHAAVSELLGATLWPCWNLPLLLMVGEAEKTGKRRQGMAVLGQTSPDRAEQIYLDDQPCCSLGASRRAPGADMIDCLGHEMCEKERCSG